MIYLNSFRVTTKEQDEGYFNPCDSIGTFRKRSGRTCYESKYPFMLFRNRGLPELEFRDITVFCGNNGSGKSTLLNIISEKLELNRGTVFNRTDFFEDYVAMCDYELETKLPGASRIITSDDVFDRLLDIRRINDGIDRRREELFQEFISEKEHGDSQLHGLDDYDRWKKTLNAKRMNSSTYLRSHLRRNMEERSNGESALSFFVDSISEDALYLLDEPENSLSPQNQLELKKFIEDSVRYFHCQFIISTHSPFLLSLSGARIYDLDSTPVAVRDWTELDCVRVYHDFFRSHDDLF